LNTNCNLFCDFSTKNHFVQLYWCTFHMLCYLLSNQHANPTKYSTCEDVCCSVETIFCNLAVFVEVFAVPSSILVCYLVVPCPTADSFYAAKCWGHVWFGFVVNKGDRHCLVVHVNFQLITAMSHCVMTFLFVVTCALMH